MKRRGRTPVRFLSSLAVVGLLLAACAPAVAPTATPSVGPTLVTTPEIARSSPTLPAPTLAPQPRPSPTSPAPAAEGPKYGGVLKRNFNDGPGRLDLHQAVSYADVIPMSPVYNLLVRIDLDDPTKVIPDLAQSWEVSPDGKVYTFRLAQGVQWHDGKPFTSADVKASFERIAFPPKDVNSPRQSYYTALERIEAPDEKTVKFVLQRPQASFLIMLGVPFSVVFPKHLLDQKVDLTQSRIGTGPFRFKEYLRGVSFSVEKNSNYFKKGRPYLDGMTGYIIPDAGASVAALKTKAIDAIVAYPVLSPAERAAIKSVFPEMIIKSVPTPNIRALIPNFKKKPWSDPRVVKALMLVNDQRSVIEVVKFGDGVAGGFMTPGPWAISQEELEKMPGFRKPTEEDASQTRRLLAEAGYSEGFKLPLLVRNLQDSIRMGTYAKDHLGKFGIEANLVIKDAGPFQQLRVVGDWDAMPYSILSVELNEPDIVLSRYLSESPGNYSKYNNPVYDKAYIKQSQTIDPAERKNLILEMQRMLIENPPAIPWYWDVFSELSWPWVKGFRWLNQYVGDWDLENVWLAR